MLSIDLPIEVERYLGLYPQDRLKLDQVVSLMEMGLDLTNRATAPGHVTVSAIVLNDEGRLLMVRHRALERWLAPGGHLEPADRTLAEAALRELGEETGLHPGKVRPISVAAMDVDTHAIPANPVKGEPDHLHFDFRFVFESTAADVRLQQSEVTGWAWRPWREIPCQSTRERVAAWLER